MKVAVITRHAVTNYGSLLQALATQNVISNLGHESVIIDYVRNDEHYRNIEKTILKSKPSWNSNPIKKFCYLAFRETESISAGKKFENQRKKLLNLTRTFSDFEQLCENPPEADVYMTGSDQVWGPVGSGILDEAYCLSFADKSKKKISYAASFGKSELTEENKDFFKSRLSDYHRIAVREDSAVKMLDSIGIDSTQVLDPTLLIEREQWSEYIGEKPNKKYVLVYQLHNDPTLGKYAEQVAKKKGLPLIRVSASFHQITREGRFVYAPSVQKFLSYVKYADCMITDSFHGTAFAINFNVPFVEILPNNNTQSRNQSILKLTGLTDRILSDNTDYSLSDKPIDYERVNLILKKEREKSLSVLKSMIED
ncbi:MAG: polysaccharide pyruvyl transferase family protein [Clostridia bacterium]|nr:polysaccharide pyruvyl transferase family protein [Clostridia bacterium]